MKPFATYQHLDDGRDTERGVREKDSKFWNEGKFNTFVVPLLPDDCSGMTFVEMGCNAGLFLKMAEDRGFSKVVGVEASEKAFKRGLEYRERVGGNYDIQFRYMERSIKHMPVADYTVFVNSHYYMHIDQWLKYLDVLQSKTEYCIIVTDKKANGNYCIVSADVDEIKKYFKLWELVDHIPIQKIKDVHPRNLQALCFKSPSVERVSMDDLDCGNHVQGHYYKALDKNVHPLHTRYFKILRGYRKKKWSKEKLEQFMMDKVKLYESVKKYGLLNPIIVNSDGRVLDGNHRFMILKHLGHSSVLARRV